MRLVDYRTPSGNIIFFVSAPVGEGNLARMRGSGLGSSAPTLSSSLVSSAALFMLLLRDWAISIHKSLVPSSLQKLQTTGVLVGG